MSIITEINNYLKSKIKDFVSFEFHGNMAAPSTDEILADLTPEKRIFIFKTIIDKLNVNWILESTYNTGEQGYVSHLWDLKASINGEEEEIIYSSDRQDSFNNMNFHKDWAVYMADNKSICIIYEDDEPAFYLDNRKKFENKPENANISINSKDFFPSYFSAFREVHFKYSAVLLALLEIKKFEENKH